MGYNSPDNLHDDFSWDIKEVIDGGDGDAPELNDGMVVGMLLVLGFGCMKGPEVRAGRL